ncbi:MAG: nicotinate phosphoribosyltransferase, partial [Acinetobacter sp.]
SCNIVFGIGSYTYNYLTRDTFGFAVKATWGQVNGQGRELFKDPITDSGVKKSAKGLLRVEQTADGFTLFDQQTSEQEQQGAFAIVFENGKLIRECTLDEIRARLT